MLPVWTSEWVLTLFLVILWFFTMFCLFYMYGNISSHDIFFSRHETLIYFSRRWSVFTLHIKHTHTHNILPPYYTHLSLFLCWDVSISVFLIFMKLFLHMTYFPIHEILTDVAAGWSACVSPHILWYANIMCVSVCVSVLVVSISVFLTCMQIFLHMTYVSQYTAYWQTCPCSGLSLYSTLRIHPQYIFPWL